MATTLPRPSGPPTAALPALPVSKNRKSLATKSSTSDLRTTSPLPKSGLRQPSSSHLATPSSSTTSIAVPKTRTPGVNAAGKTIRKTISINSFPQPPRSSLRNSSLPPSPLSGGATTGTGSVRDSVESSPGSRKVSRIGQKPKRSSKSPVRQSYISGSTPSLLNGSGDSKSISSGPGARGSDGLLSLPSPPQSRSSSTQDSYSTSATNYDETVENGVGTTANIEKRASKGEAKGNVLVSVRVRPDAKTGEANSADGEWMVDGRRSLVAYQGRESGDYYYDNVFAAHDNNARVYDACAKRLVRRVMEGYHGTVFAYGMTGTGKTFSMQGTATSPGVIPLAITDIFSYIRETPSREFLLRVSYLEIYNEKIHDLLSATTGAGAGPTQPQEEIKLREDSKRGVYATPLKEEIVQSPTQLLRVIARGDHARRTGSTQFNARSSRSHAVVQIVVESRERILPGTVAEKRSGLTPGGVRVSTLSLIDLAGSEKAAESKERRTEGSHINKSLLTLGTVIARLSETKDKDGKADGKHLPYRDSKLTRLLQGALSGNSLVSILCTIQIGSAGTAATANSHTTETLNTLKFASRAKNNIVSHAKKAEESLGQGSDGARVLLERYRMEIVELRKQLEDQAKQPPPTDVDEEEEREREREAEQRHEEQMLEMQLARTALKERIEHLNRLILSSKSIGVNASGSFSSLGFHRMGPRASNSHLSMTSARSSMTPSLISNRQSLERAVSMQSTSTLGQPQNENQLAGEQQGSGDDDESINEPGTATLQAQNHALQQDLADKNRYISVLERRLLQARRSSHSRTSFGISGGAKAGIMVGEDHSVAALLKEKDDEIADLRARLDDKDHMLTALRSAARSRDNADRSAEVPPPRPAEPQRSLSNSDASLKRSLSSPKTRKSLDEMSRMLDEMIQDRVEHGQLVKGVRGSVRLPARRHNSADGVGNIEGVTPPMPLSRDTSAATVALEA